MLKNPYNTITLSLKHFKQRKLGGTNTQNMQNITESGSVSADKGRHYN